MNSVRQLFFDAAGTLFRPRHSAGQVYRTIAKRLDLTSLASLDSGSIDHAFRLALAHHSPLCFPKLSRTKLQQAEHSWWRRVVNDTFGGLTDVRPDATFFESVYHHFSTADAWKREPGCRRILAKLDRAGFRMAIVSNFDSRLPGVLEGLELGNFFSAVVISSGFGVAKPDPAIFRAALTATGSSATESVHLGDDFQNDFLAARAAGLKAILYDPGNRRTTIRPRFVHYNALADFLL